MKKSAVITIICFALGIVLLAGCFILFTENNISSKLFPTTTTTTTAPTDTVEPEPAPEYNLVDFFEEDVSQWMTLGEYKNLTVKVDQLKISDADIDLEIHITICQNDLHSKQLSGKITENVIFNFDFTGYLLNEDGTRGEAFDGGAGINQLAYIDGNDFITVSADGLGSFIDGFAQGMLGMSVDETKTLDITFPENYGNEDMAGQKVEFDVKINYIAQTSLDDATVKRISNEEYATVKEYRNYIKEDMEAALKEQNENYALEQILNNATLIVGEEACEDYIFALFCDEVDYYVQMYASYGMSMSFGDMLTQFGFNSVDELREYADEYAASEQGKLVIKSNILPYALIASENLEVTDEEYDIFMETLVEQMGSTKEEIVEEYGEEYIKQVILLNEAQTALDEAVSTAKYVLE